MLGGWRLTCTEAVYFSVCVGQNAEFSSVVYVFLTPLLAFVSDTHSYVLALANIQSCSASFRVGVLLTFRGLPH